VILQVSCKYFKNLVLSIMENTPTNNPISNYNFNAKLNNFRLSQQKTRCPSFEVSAGKLKPKKNISEKIQIFFETESEQHK
jgi:hypothetical protein